VAHLCVSAARGIARAEPICQSVPGRGLDEAIGRVLIETVTPPHVGDGADGAERAPGAGLEGN
jgi:hypothetical protein